MSSLAILNQCIACDACRDVCPTQAIHIGEPIYTIMQQKCILCAGYAENPSCIEVCPVDAIIYTTKNMEQT
ncbi:MAG: 4Fe-4S binding protein [Helicobacter trogontum]|uniref:4Fe-4S dicluster domain-containing protein n=1 Tax=Helicobacter trogontum TaxID=50960 RepID=A0A4U8TBB1_9HELI|nr:4Fe-4S binding protein [Helicobacter trogontum]MCI5787083.1 4Fe-4S binding protein [Helicobacter trogontum]TLD97043.1 4Fe-4S dicluster domain-containing protein [Helicobacter trogontum]